MVWCDCLTHKPDPSCWSDTPQNYAQDWVLTIHCPFATGFRDGMTCRVTIRGVYSMHAEGSWTPLERTLVVGEVLVCEVPSRRRLVVVVKGGGGGSMAEYNSYSQPCSFDFHTKKPVFLMLDCWFGTLHRYSWVGWHPLNLKPGKGDLSLPFVH